jgi:MobA/MobL family
MFSERKLDGIDRTAEQHFKRYNAKTPERGGCQKASGGKTKDELKASLLQTRKGWADLQNKHLTRHGHAVQVTHLSLAAQGIQREVEPHLGPSRAKEYAQAVRNDRSAAKTPDVPKPQAVNVESVLRAYGYIKGALEKVTAEQKARETAETQKLDAAEAQAKDSEGLGGVLVHQIQQLGKRPMLMSGKWDAQDKALRAQFAEAKQANQQARERLKESQKRLDDLKAANTLDMRVKRAIESLDMPYTQKTLDVMQLGAKITQERQQAQEQAKAQEKALQKAQQPDKGQSR